MDKMDIAMYDAFQKLLREDGHLKQTDIFAFRLGWRECQAAQQNMHWTAGIVRRFKQFSVVKFILSLWHSLASRQ